MVLLADPSVAIVDDSGFGSVSESKVVSLVECCAFNGLRLLGNISLVESLDLSLVDAMDATSGFDPLSHLKPGYESTHL